MLLCCRVGAKKQPFINEQTDRSLRTHLSSSSTTTRQTLTNEQQERLAHWHYSGNTVHLLTPRKEKETRSLPSFPFGVLRERTGSKRG
ncbi:unnamed protein product [Ectocarpus sp. 12 AP-2014]